MYHNSLNRNPTSKILAGPYSIYVLFSCRACLSYTPLRTLINIIWVLCKQKQKTIPKGDIVSGWLLEQIHGAHPPKAAIPTLHPEAKTLLGGSIRGCLEVGLQAKVTYIATFIQVLRTLLRTELPMTFLNPKPLPARHFPCLEHGAPPCWEISLPAL